MNTKESRLGLYRFLKDLVVGADLQWCAMKVEDCGDTALVQELFGESVSMRNGYLEVTDEKLFFSKLMTALTGIKVSVV